MVDTETIFSGVEQKEVSTKFPIPIYSGEGCYIECSSCGLTFTDLAISEEDRVLLDAKIKRIKGKYYPDTFEAEVDYRERVEIDDMKKETRVYSLNQIYVKDLNGTCGPCMEIEDSLSFSHTNRARDILFFQECLAEYLELKGMEYPHIRSYVKNGSVFLTFRVNGELIWEEIDIQKPLSGQEFLQNFTAIVRNL